MSRILGFNDVQRGDLRHFGVSYGLHLQSQRVSQAINWQKQEARRSQLTASPYQAYSQALKSEVI
jgi:hypothetical protein